MDRGRRAARGDFAGSFDAFVTELRALWPSLPEDATRRMARAYGTRVEQMLGDAKALADMGRDLGGGVSEAELAYLRREEFARTADDVLWRRSKLGLHTGAKGHNAVATALDIDFA